MKYRAGMILLKGLGWAAKKGAGAGHRRKKRQMGKKWQEPPVFYRSLKLPPPFADCQRRGNGWAAEIPAKVQLFAGFNGCFEKIPAFMQLFQGSPLHSGVNAQNTCIFAGI